MSLTEVVVVITLVVLLIEVVVADVALEVARDDTLTVVVEAVRRGVVAVEGTRVFTTVERVEAWVAD